MHNSIIFRHVNDRGSKNNFVGLCITKSEPASEFRMQEQTMTELTVTKTRTMKNDEDSNDDERYTKFMKAFCAGCGSEVRNE